MPRKIHTCPVCHETVRQRSAQVRQGGYRWHRGCYPGGRPETPRGTGGAMVQVRLSLQERAALDYHASQAHVTAAELVRRTLDAAGLMDV